ncbi:transposase [Paenibacillus sp. NPDC058174]|uniref:transposase n=1 Tax=Paenibacillus sp. NPDC058174 TaxID=3346366 RepID=UPI0036DE303C
MEEEVKLKVVREASSGVKVGVLARKYDIHEETIRQWVREYRDETGKHDKPDETLQEVLRLREVEEKYNKINALIREKELENEIFRELLKKVNPAYRPDSK